MAKGPENEAGPVADLVMPATAEEEEEGGFGVFLKQQTSSAAAPPEAPVSPAPGSLRPLAAIKAGPPPTAPVPEIYSDPAEKRPQSNSPPPTPTPEPMSASTLQKMKDQGMYRNQYFKDADCFDCNHKFKVSRSSRSANCPNCGAYISLEDVEINMPSNQSIRTRGDVLIRKRGHLSTDSVQCKDFRCQGIVEANVTAAGDAIFRTTGTIIGEVHCKRFVIEKGAEVTFMNEVRTEEADVQGNFTGALHCAGPLIIGATGSVNGDVTIRSVSIEPGGELNGAMNILRTQTMPRPKPSGEG